MAYIFVASNYDLLIAQIYMTQFAFAMKLKTQFSEFISQAIYYT